MIRISVLFGVLLLFFSCGQKSKSDNKLNLKKEVQTFAQHFQIKFDKQGAFIEILDPDQKTVERELRPIKSKGKSLRIIAMSSTHIGMLDKLGLAENIVGVSDIKYVWNKTVRKNFEKGIVVSAPSVEEIIQLKPDVIFYDGFGKEYPHQKQLEQLGIQCIQNYDWRENHPLGKAEWIQFFGILLNKEKDASSYFSEIVIEYNSLISKIIHKKKPTTVLSGNVIGDSWYVPAGESYNAQLFKDAKCVYFYTTTKGTGSLALTLEEVLKNNVNATIWINPGMASLEALKRSNPKAKFFDSVKNKEVFCYTKKGNYFWEMSAIEPQKVLSDIIEITHHDSKMRKKLYFYSQLN